MTHPDSSKRLTLTPFGKHSPVPNKSIANIQTLMMSSSSTQRVVTSSITLIISPYHVGVQGDAVGAGPIHLVQQGLASTLQAFGVDVREITVKPSMNADGDIGRSFEVIRQTAKLVTEARNASSFPIVLSGNCSATVGVHAGLSRCKEFEKSDVGCVWFDVSGA